MEREGKLRTFGSFFLRDTLCIYLSVAHLAKTLCMYVYKTQLLPISCRCFKVLCDSLVLTAWKHDVAPILSRFNPHTRADVWPLRYCISTWKRGIVNSRYGLWQTNQLEGIMSFRQEICHIYGFHLYQSKHLYDTYKKSECSAVGLLLSPFWWTESPESKKVNKNLDNKWKPDINSSKIRKSERIIGIK